MQMTFSSPGRNWRSLLLSLTAFSLTFASSAAIAQSDTKTMEKDWITFFEMLQKRHKNPFFATSSEVFQAKQKDFFSKIDTMNREEQIVGFAKLVALVGDGHTWMPMHALPFDGMPEGPNFHALPVRFELFDDGLFVVGANKKHADLIGGEITHIGHTPIDVAIERTMEMLPKDAVNFSRDFVADWLVLAELLTALDITKESPKIELAVVKNGINIDSQISPLRAEFKYDWIFGIDSAPSGTDGPLSNWQTGALKTPMWREDVKSAFRQKRIKNDVFYLQINQIRNTDRKKLREVASEIVSEANVAGAGSAIIIDLRNCIGGNGLLVPAFLTELDKLVDGANIAVLISRKTHSAGIMLVSALEQSSRTKFFGQPTADRPNHYGETNIFVLPNSKLPVVHASEYYQTSSSDDLRLFKKPNYPVPYLSSDYRNGFDRTLSEALSFLKRK